MRPSFRPTSIPTLAARRYATASPASNPQVKSAVESAGKAYEGALASAKKVAGPVGERVGSMMGGYKEPIMFNFKVFTSLCRQVYIAEGLAPPLQLSQWASTYAKVWSRATSPAWYKQVASSGEWAKIAIYGLEAYGIFKLGEIIGRRNLQGYSLKE